MVSLNWVLNLPKGLTEEQFETWYLGHHTFYVDTAHGIRRYCVNRALSDQPEISEGSCFRVAQEYWADWESMEHCWNSSTGHALLGDGQANMGLDPGTVVGIALTEDEQLEVANPAVFSTVRRGYRSRPDGTHVKLLAYGMAKKPAEIGAWYKDRFGGLGRDPRVREHVFGTSLGRVIEVGLLSTIPGQGQAHYDWLLEMWFDDAGTASAYFESEAFRTMWSKLGDACTLRTATLVRGQERIIMADPIAHLDD
ncbi:hypothetical protein [Streptomyces sp. CA-106131]|uniref:hypothetical protein n=1 Tax=Streptomyces sp. CA-106131 TaxID=3240045 RepID=UPI003D93B61D